MKFTGLHRNDIEKIQTLYDVNRTNPKQFSFQSMSMIPQVVFLISAMMQSRSRITLKDGATYFFHNEKYNIYILNTIIIISHQIT